MILKLLKCIINCTWNKDKSSLINNIIFKMPIGVSKIENLLFEIFNKISLQFRAFLKKF